MLALPPVVMPPFDLPSESQDSYTELSRRLSFRLPLCSGSAVTAFSAESIHLTPPLSTAATILCGPPPDSGSAVQALPKTREDVPLPGHYDLCVRGLR
jgi:hypothetical protein